MKHLYGIVPTNQALVSEPGMIGVHGAAIHTIAHNGIAALVSDSPYADYTNLYKPDLAKMLADHQRVTEKMMSKAPVLLPVKFGTLLYQQEMQTLLNQFHTDLETALEALVGKVEIELVVTWQLERIFAEIAQDPTIAQLRAVVVNQSPAEMQQQQIRVGQLVKASLDMRRETYQRQILEHLRGVADDVEINPIFNDQVVANLAFLLPARKQAEFDRLVEGLDTQLDSQLNFKIVGPLPAYSFSTLAVLKIDPKEITWAQKILNLGDSATAEEIRAAYHHQARQYHPDVAQNNPAAVERFQEVSQACHLLQHCYAVQYQAAQVKSPKREFRCSFSPAAVAGTFLVNIYRSSELAS
jgi:Gas vesicle synthesis protein GvpL/GvpF/DnaJ domain